MITALFQQVSFMVMNVLRFAFTGAKGKILIIPVLIDENYRENIPRFIYHLFYLDYIRLEENLFWNKLAFSLGWKPTDQEWFR